MNIDEIEDILEEFLNKHDINLEEVDIGEVIYQRDGIQEDVIDCFIKILEACTP